MRLTKRLGAIVCAAVFGLLLAGALAPGSASAHEQRDLLGGKYHAVVGFLTEPAYDNQLNGLDLTITDKTQQGPDGKDKPVEGLEKTLKAEVLYGGKTLPLTLRTRFNMPGHYAAYFEPTKAGQYRFHVSGQINGQNVDETFESGPGRFNDIESLGALQFPEAAGAATTDLQARLDAAQSRANTAQTIGIAGLVVGLIGLSLGSVAFIRQFAGQPKGRVATQPGRGD